MYKQRSSNKLNLEELPSSTDLHAPSMSNVTPGGPGSVDIRENTDAPGAMNSNNNNNNQMEGEGMNNSYVGSNISQIRQITNSIHGASSVVTVGVLENADGTDFVDSHENQDDVDESLSSEAEMENLRNEIVAQAIAKGVTPGGPTESVNDTNSNVNENKHNKMGSVEMGIALAELIEERDRQRAESKHEQDRKDSKFGRMLSDKLMAIDMIQDDIVNDINNEGGDTIDGENVTPM